MIHRYLEVLGIVEGDVTLQRISIEHKSVLRNLMELCQHDYSEFNGEEINEHGLFGYGYLDNYWTEAGRHPFFVLASGNLAGFALVRTLAEDDNGKPSYSLAEFLSSVNTGIRVLVDAQRSRFSTHSLVDGGLVRKRETLPHNSFGAM